MSQDRSTGACAPVASLKTEIVTHVTISRIDADPERVAWLAGLYEGEGYCGSLTQGGFEVVIASTDLDVLLRAWAIADCGRIRSFAAVNERSKPVHRWRVGARADVIEVLSAIRPYLLSRRGDRVDEVLAWYADNPPRAMGRPRLVRDGSAVSKPDSCSSTELGNAA